MRHPRVRPQPHEGYVDHPLLPCTRCDEWTVHSFALEERRLVGNAPLEHPVYVQWYECGTCQHRRVYGWYVMTRGKVGLPP